jgi:GNAT superfamily N-acetyltransferase
MVVGDGRYAAIGEEKSKHAELAFIVAEPYRGRGVASLLLRHLAQIAQQAGLVAFEADVLAYNEPLLTVLQRAAFPIHREHQGDIVHVTLWLTQQGFQTRYC